MDISRGRCLLAPHRIAKGWSQRELSVRTGYDKKERIGFSDRMISHFELYDGKGKGKPMSPEAMYTFSKLFGIDMKLLYEWYANGVLESE